MIILRLINDNMVNQYSYGESMVISRINDNMENPY